ncbi:hypothetical protein ABXN37_26465 [Piscinibacter sakaiensis]|uniref:hypothetical protein n=1 Tax=Piscinibacter sakaiensis TaxID=1547922 RepID=UPI0037268513
MQGPATATAAAASIATAAEHRPDAATARHAIHQPALPLADALREITRQSGHPVVFDAGAVTGREAPAIGGWMTVGEAVGWVVEGAGLCSERLHSGGVIVRGCRESGAGAAGGTASHLEASSTTASARDGCSP